MRGEKYITPTGRDKYILYRLEAGEEDFRVFGSVWPFRILFFYDF
jgi:hypothetical protein